MTAQPLEDGQARLWPRLEDLVPPELPPEIAVARLVALARSLLIENRQLREILHRPPDLVEALEPTDGAAA
jgi:hypothetical protein